MSKKNKNLEILENIKKNDPRFKDLEIVKSCPDFPSYEQFLKDIEYIKSDLKNNMDVIYAVESNKTSY